jgi:AbrB family looped-hinge helix DNA binding protein
VFKVIYLYGKEIFSMETYATVKGQIVIPASLRRKYGIKNGTKIIVTDIGDAIVLKPVTEQYLKNLQGSLKGKGGLKVLMEERNRDKEREK